MSDAEIVLTHEYDATVLVRATGEENARAILEDWAREAAEINGEWGVTVDVDVSLPASVY